MISNQQHTNHPAIHVSDAQSAKNRICGGVLGELEITHVKSLQGGTSGALQQEISELELFNALPSSPVNTVLGWKQNND